MKKTTLSLFLFLLAMVSSAMAIDKAALDDRVRLLTTKFENLQGKVEKAVPASVLSQAQGIILLDRTRAGFIFAFQGGGGVAMAKDPKTQKWGPAAFVSANEGSLGFQVGGEQAFFVILLMNTNATRELFEPNVELGSEARGTAGSASGGAESSTTWTGQPVMVYGDRKGLYGGASVKAGGISPDDEANRIYYGEVLTARQILVERKVKVSETAVDLAAKLKAQANLANK